MIWMRLKEVYGDPKVMLNRKFEEFQKLGSLWKIRDTEKLMDALQVVNLMKDLKKLVKDHKIQNELYYGDGLERVFKLLGDRRLEKWIAETCEKKLSKEENWDSVIQLLEREATVLQHKKIFLGKDDTVRRFDGRQEKAFLHTHDESTKSKSNTNLTCSICGETGHVDRAGPNQTRLIQYFTCK